jgi:predicted metal-dependent phosphoesterase TrpH
VIDLHLHTTASDGRSSPRELVREAADAGLTTIAVTDHDTTAAVGEVEAAGQAQGLNTIPGIEITAIHRGRDVHILAYFVRTESEDLASFLARQRTERRRRLNEMIAALERAGAPIDREALDARLAVESTKSVGRPLLARELMRAGHVRSTSEAFDRYLAEGRPGYVQRTGATPREVIELVAQAKGLTSLAHPGKLKRDEILPELVEAGLPAIEVHHPDHDDIDRGRYRHFAGMYGLLVTGGSDYHGPGSGRTAGLGRVTLDREDFDRLVERAGWSGSSS